MYIIDSQGNTRYLGNRVPMKAASGDQWTVYGDVPQTPLVPDSQWEALTSQFNYQVYDHPDLPYVHDQNGKGQCNAEATTGAEEFTRAVQGLDFIKLSAGDLYDRINGGSDNGSLLEDAMAVMTDPNNGVATAESYGGTIWRGRGSSQHVSTDERKRFGAREAYLCPTFAHCFSAALSGFAIISGIMWYPNFETDESGWLPLSGSGRAGGHAIFGYKPTMRKYGSRTVFGIWHQNSWNESFGVRGRMVVPQTHYDNAIGGWWAIRQATDEGGGLPEPKFPTALSAYVNAA